MERFSKQYFFYIAVSVVLHTAILGSFHSLFQNITVPVDEKTGSRQEFDILYEESHFPNKTHAKMNSQLSNSSHLIPPRLLQSKKIDYPQIALEKGLEGQIVSYLTLNPQGQVENIEIIQSTNPAFLTEEVRAQLKDLRFTPATRMGKPVSLKVKYIYNFRLE